MVLSYRHGFHAGNAGDVVKHSVLALLFTSLATKKPRPFLFLDTHAAAGRYLLHYPSLPSPHSEYRSGIARLWTHKHPPPALTPYLHAVRAINGFAPLDVPPPPVPLSTSPAPSTLTPTDDVHRWFSLPAVAPSYPAEAYAASSLVHYPGSPSLFLHLRRPQDRMLAYELHPTEQANLTAFLSSQHSHAASYPFYPAAGEEAISPRVSKVMAGSGFDSFGVLPQPERRGLVFVDPPYEVEGEYDQVVMFAQKAVQRWATPTYAVWYPLIRGKEELADRMRAQLQATGRLHSHSAADTCPGHRR